MIICAECENEFPYHKEFCSARRSSRMSDSPTLNAMVENARKIKMTPDQQLEQALDFAYGNLACTTHHRPSKEVFKTLAMERGMSATWFELWASKREWK